jgi:hypothetical protein
VLGYFLFSLATELKMQTQQVKPASIRTVHSSPVTALFDQVTRYQQRELKPTPAEARLISRARLVKALLNYMDRMVEHAEGNRTFYNHANRIANARFNPTTSVEELVFQLRSRIHAIFEVKKITLH